MKLYRNITNCIAYKMSDEEAQIKLSTAPYNVLILPFNSDEDVAKFNKARQSYVEDNPDQDLIYQEIDLNGNFVKNVKPSQKEAIGDKKITESNLKDL